MFIIRSLKSWDMPSINVGFANGAEIDLKIDEKFTENDMVKFLENYANQNGIGGNILSGKLLSTGLGSGHVRIVNKRKIMMMMTTTTTTTTTMMMMMMMMMVMMINRLVPSCTLQN